MHKTGIEFTSLFLSGKLNIEHGLNKRLLTP